MLRCMYSGISGMKVNQTKLDVIGNNIANVGTTAYKSSSTRFKDMLYQSSSEATAPTPTLGGTNAKQVGLGAQLSSINKVMGQGNALSTGRSLDLCVDGDGYLIVGKGSLATGNIPVTTDHAIGNGSTMDNTLYTRDGNLTLDKDGNLLTSDGYRVMGYYTNSPGVSISTSTGVAVATYVDADKAVFDPQKLVPLAIPDKVTTSSGGTQPIKKFEIGKDGVITAVLGDGTRSALGQIAMANFKNPEGLTSIGGDLLQTSSNSGDAIIRSSKGTLAPDDNSSGFGSFIQGALEGSNVDLTEQFTDMITANRSFQAASKMVTTGDEILQTITGLIR